MKIIQYILHTVEDGYKLYQTELFFGILAGLFLLAILTLVAVHRCRKQIRRLAENTKEMTKAALGRNSTAGRLDESYGKMDAAPLPERMAVTKEKEELFGSVIQEIFP